MQERNLTELLLQLEEKFPHLRGVKESPTAIPDEAIIHWLARSVESQRPAFVPGCSAERMALAMAFYSGCCWAVMKLYTLRQREAKNNDSIL